MTFGERLKELRKSKKITIRELERRINMSNAIISQYENNLREPGMKAIIKLCKFYEVSSDYLLGIEEDKPNGTQDS